MINIIDKSRCCGCEVCTNVCPKKCIEMTQDNWGFYYPVVDKDACINCGLCEMVCPFINQPICKKFFAYAAQSKDKNILIKSASGGVFTTISKYIIENDGVSVGAAYNDRIIMHTIVNRDKDVMTHSSSKYVQSRIYNTYNNVKDILEKGVTVLFSGTPCQVNALKNFINKDYDNLFTVDLVCAGVASPGIFDKYIKIMESNDNSIVDLNFRFKKYGYHSSTMFLKYGNGHKYYRSKLTDIMSNVFNSYIALRPSCTKCKAKGVNRCSDITIFDCWHYLKLTNKKDNDQGWTNIIINSNKGKHLINDCKELFFLDEIDIDSAIQLDGNMYFDSHPANIKSNDFFKDVDKYGLCIVVKKYNNINFLSNIKEVIKPILYKIGLLNIVKKLFVK